MDYYGLYFDLRENDDISNCVNCAGFDVVNCDRDTLRNEDCRFVKCNICELDGLDSMNMVL